MSVGAVVVAFRSGAGLWESCEDLARSDEVECVIIVNNETIKLEVGKNLSETLRGKLRVIDAQENLGYAGGNNLGIHAVLEYGLTHVLVCNPDIRMQASTIGLLVAEMEDKRLDIVSPCLIEDTQSRADKVLTEPGWDMVLGRGVLDKSASTTQKFFTPTFFGACFLARSDVFRMVGLLSPFLFLYCEELDFVERMRRLGGIEWGIALGVQANHGRGASVSPQGYSSSDRSIVSVEHAARSAVIVARLYWPALLPLWIMTRLGVAVRYGTKKRLRLTIAVLHGVWSGLATRLGASN